MSDTTNREASNSGNSDIPRQQTLADNSNLSQFGDDRKPDRQSLFSAINQKIRSKLPTFHNPLKRFIKSRNQREADSEITNINHSVIDPGVKKVDELASLDSASTLNEQSTAKSNTSIYRSEHHSVADAARTRESCQDLASYFSEDPDEPSTSAANTIVLSASTFDRDVEPSENLHYTTLTSTTSTSLESSEITETVSSSMNTEEVSETDFMDALPHSAIIAMAPMELALSAQLGNEISNVSEIVGSRTDQRIGRDDPRDFYDRTLRMVIRKPICPQEDEPSIY